jgi:predicted dehydrogenase
MDDKDIDAVVIATPNQWHALATVWALQAGKHVYVEKPSSHTVWEGRQMVDAAARYKKLVQVGTMNRSRPAVRDAIKLIHEGGIGKVYMARGLCFKPRPAIGQYPDGPMKPGEQYKLNITATANEPPYNETYLSKVDYNLWLGPAPTRPFNRNHFHYNWHWHWNYGNGDSGNQGPHQFDIARWGLQKQEHPVKIRSTGGYFGAESSQETPNLQTTLFEYADGRSSSSRRAAASPTTKAPVKIGNLFYGTKGWLWIEEAANVAVVLRAEEREGTGRRTPPMRQRADRADDDEYPALPELHRRDSRRRSEGAHVRRARGPLSSALPHLGNISYRVGRRCSSTARRRRSSTTRTRTAC